MSFAGRLAPAHADSAVLPKLAFILQPPAVFEIGDQRAGADQSDAWIRLQIPLVLLEMPDQFFEDFYMGCLFCPAEIQLQIKLSQNLHIG